MANPTARPKRGTDMSLYQLTDGQDMHQRHPDTFGVPNDEELAALRVGDFVKLGFQSDDDEEPGERMWVEVTDLPIAVDFGSIHVGRLANQPVVYTHLRPDMAIAFQLRHVLAIDGPASVDN